MYLAQYIIQAKSPEDAIRLCQFARTVMQLDLAVTSGFQSGECWTATDDPCLIQLEQHWGNLAALEWWQASPKRQRLVQQAQIWMAAPFQTRLFKEVA